MSQDVRVAPGFINGDVSFWMRDIGLPTQRASLAGDIEVDVAIVGGGLTGLWTAYYLTKAQPELEIAIVEKYFAGFGASGRNGGWMSAEPAGQFRRYAAAHGAESARAMQREMFTAVDEVVTVAQQEGFAEDLVKDGLIHVATNGPQLARARAHLDELREQGWGKDDVFELGVDDLRERVNVHGMRGGYWTPHCARVHPAKFTRGLAAVVEALGVTIYEGTTAESIAPRAVRTDHGTVRAKYVVQALEGYTHSLPRQERRLLPMNSSMIVTERLTEQQLDAIGWRGAELVGDMAHGFTYMQRTADGRVALGGRAVPYDFNSSFDERGRTADRSVGMLSKRLGEVFPALRNVQIDHSWSGVLGVPRDWCAAVNFDRDAGILSAGGYVGHGLSGTNLAARTLRDLILGEQTDLVRLPWVGRTARNWEPEPLRWIGATALYAVYRAADGRENHSQSGKTDVLARAANVISGR
ncbi:NAD(P)/FAD-dependent oxidoreductase [Gulosibacter molinativorax]|uniref:FAD-dependent oxidoreductase n=1 Tax=Gulosibacter molinativorax TaxID=256821 RepID=A0ABT7CAW8_9MICO|nr:FAD-binding oxidoreductase [Gulosibacter molinativorax]MDJ1372289.1 FAD-dependent oxidoreductase [Gulosibacter molinativorax]QUY63383.1 FAD-dependent oxidoreductase [Gulosibacter molinativorax]